VVSAGLGADDVAALVVASNPAKLRDGILKIPITCFASTASAKTLPIIIQNPSLALSPEFAVTIALQPDVNPPPSTPAKLLHNIPLLQSHNIVAVAGRQKQPRCLRSSTSALEAFR